MTSAGARSSVHTVIVLYVQHKMNGQLFSLNNTPTLIQFKQNPGYVSFYKYNK